MKQMRLYGLIVVALVAAGCKASSTPAPTQAQPPTQGQAYLGVTATVAPASAYPATAIATPDPSAVAFILDLPLKSGATVVTGRGPAGVVVSIENVTTMGTELGSAVIGADNRFSASVPPLEAHVRIGLALKDTGSSGKQPADFNADVYKGPGALMLPQVGYYLDSALVQP